VADGPVAGSHWWPGTCGLPRTGSGTCASGDSGVLDLPRPGRGRQGSETRKRDNDKEACLTLCSGCARCRHVSLSSVHHQCWWFWECPPLDALTIGPPGEPRIRGYLTTSIKPALRMVTGRRQTPQPALQANSALPAEMAAEGWVQLESALEGRRPECARQACDSDACAAYRHRHRAGAGAGLRKLRNTAGVCPCACSLCLDCAVQVDRWRSPTGQLVHSLVTKTEPPFTFAYNPNDADMDKMLVDLITEPALTIAWHAATWRCCQAGGLVLDVGANFGWYTLFSVALGCRVVNFEPVPMWRDVLRLGIALNGYGARVRVVPKVVSNFRGAATLAVPRPEAADLERGGKLLLGMTGVVGPAGLLKGYMNSHQAVRIQANSTRLDDELTGSDANVCMLKADVEGYEPQVLLTAKRMLRMRRVRAVQLELTRANDPKQVQANINMLEQLVAQNLTIRHVRHDTRVYSPQGGIVHDWRAHSKTAFASFQHFPLPGRSVASGWAREFGFSTNVLAVQDEMSL